MNQLSEQFIEKNGDIENKSFIRRIAFAVCFSNLVGMISYLALSVWVFQETNSYALSSIIFGCQWILPLIWPTGIARLTENIDIRKMASWSEWMSSFLSVILLYAVTSKIILLVFIIVIVRGFCDSLTRTISSLIVKFTQKDVMIVEQGVSRIEFLRVIGTSAAGVLYSVFGENSSVQAFLVISIAVFIISGSIFRSITPINSNTLRNNYSKSGAFAKLKIALTATSAKWLWLLAIVSAFQGLHNAIRVAYPDQELGQGVVGVGIISTVSTVGVLIGGLIVNNSRVTRTIKLLPSWLLISLVGLAAIIAVYIPVAVPSYTIYFIFMVIFETTFMVFNLNLVTTTDQSNISAILGFRTTILNGSTLFGLIITSMFLTKFTASMSTLLTASLLIICSLLLSYRYKRVQR